MQIKTQIEVELHEADVKEAIQDYLGKNSLTVTAEDIETIKVTNPRNEGVRVNLTIKSESATDAIEEEDLAVEPVEPAAEPEPVTAEEEDEVIPANSVEDVMPSVDEIAAMQTSETEAPAQTPRPAFGHFGRKD